MPSSHRIRAVRKILEGMPVVIEAVVLFTDVRVASNELEVITQATVLLKAAGYKLSNMAYFDGMFYIYVVKRK